MAIWMPRRQPKREHHDCAVEGCLYWAFTQARENASAGWQWFCKTHVPQGWEKKIVERQLTHRPFVAKVAGNREET